MSGKRSAEAQVLKEFKPKKIPNKKKDVFPDTEEWEGDIHPSWILGREEDEDIY